MIESAIVTYWYITIPLVFLVYLVISYIHEQTLIRKFKAKPFTNYLNDGTFGICEGFSALKHKKAGTSIEHYREQYELLPHPDVPTYRGYVFGTPIVLTKDPENIKAILATQFNDFSLGIRHAQLDPLLGDGIFTLDHQGWKDSRAMLRPQFAREQIAHVKALEPHFQFLLKHIEKNKGQFFDIQELFFRFTVDSATEFLFGSSVSSLQDESIGCDTTDLNFAGRLEFPEAFNKSQLYLSTRALLQKLYWIYNPKEFRRCNAVVHQFSDYYINKALSFTPEDLEKNSGYVFLYELVKQTRDPKVLRDQALNILVAGRDTTAGLLSFTVFELARNPEMYSKLREEIESKFGLGKEARIEEITFENLKKCEYLKAVLNEALRMYPSVPRNSRVASRNTTLPHGGGPDGMSPVFIPKGKTVIYNIAATQRDPNYYGKDADVFRPERWFEESTKKLGWAYLPFNGGPRICLGQQFALTEASYVITRLAQNIATIELQDGYSYPPKKMTHLTMCVFDGVHVKMEK
ncbi:hypothetical protein KGF57_002263 [Candida theae]|uniref:Uncharacterized protein n=1 Tax=Candida theae TaxID=1198502 RepID=A0AAD5BFA5_9ASCO|nr:uncharacterized protein KGF57_002263 [Candida theae]KAI5958829.1 hypothetical protein KGF57_002263 [Candida theae]